MTRPRITAKPPSSLLVRAALGLHRLLERMARRVLPPEALVFTEVVGLARSEVIGALVTLGVMDELSRPSTAADLSGRLNLDADRLIRVLRAAARMGLVTLDRRGRFAASRIGRVLRSGHPSHSRELVRYFTSRANRDAWSCLPHTLQTGDARRSVRRAAIARCVHLRGTRWSPERRSVLHAAWKWFGDWQDGTGEGS